MDLRLTPQSPKQDPGLLPGVLPVLGRGGGENGRAAHGKRKAGGRLVPNDKSLAGPRANQLRRSPPRSAPAASRGHPAQQVSWECQHTRRRPAWVSALCWADVLHPVNGLASGRRACARPVLTPGPCAPCGIVGPIPIRTAPQSHPCAYRLWLRSEKDTVPSETARYRSYQDTISGY